MIRNIKTTFIFISFVFLQNQSVHLEQKYGKTAEERNRNKKILWKVLESRVNESIQISLFDDGVPFVFEFDTIYDQLRANLKLIITFVGCG